MGKQPDIKILYAPAKTYPGTVQGNYVGAQSVAGQRGTLPTFTDANSYFIAKTGLDSNAGTSAAPKLTLASLFSTTQSFNDNSGNARNLAQVGAVPYISYPCNPVPPHGNFASGPFSDANYLSGPAGLNTALSGLTTFSFEGWVYLNVLNAIADIFSVTTTAPANHYVRVASSGAVSFTINGTALTSATGLVAAGQWYWLKANYVSGGVYSTPGTAKEIWLGSSPETAALVASATQTHTFGTVNASYIGRNSSGAGASFDGYVTRAVVSVVARATSPTLSTASNIAGFYDMQTRPLMQTTPLSYIVVKDSGSYSEGLYANFPNDITAGFGIYAADGYAPTFKLTKGAIPGTYGAGNSSRVVLTSSPATTCYVSKTGNDGTGARGNAALPFLTVQAAVTATTTTGDTVEIKDSGIYTENVTLPARALTIQAASGKVPVLKQKTAGSLGGPDVGHITAASAVNLSISGLILVGISRVQFNLFYKESASETLTLSDCSVSGYGRCCSLGAVLAVSNCIFDTASHRQTTSPLAACVFSNTVIQGLLGLTNGNFEGVSATNCSFSFSSLGTFSVRAGGSRFIKCSFNYARILVGNTFGRNIGFSNCTFKNAAYSGSANHALRFADGLNAAVLDCVFYGPSTSTIQAITSDTVSVSTSVFVQNTGIIGYAYGVNLAATQINSALAGVSTLKCNVAGVSAGVADTATALADYGSVAAYVGTVVPTYSSSGVGYLSSASTTENLTLSSSSLGVFTGDSSGLRDAGSQSALFNIVMASVVLNGLTLDGKNSEEGGIKSHPDTAFTVKYCTFNNLGYFGVRCASSSSVTFSLFKTNGHAIKIGGYSTTVNNCAAYNCGGSMIQQFGRGSTLSYNSAYRCEYGQYDSDTSNFVSSSNEIYFYSSAYDYSGNGTLTYSCVGTLNPAQPNALDATCTRLSPLYRSPETGDLRLSTVETGQLYASPAQKAGTAGADMGVFAFTYGALAQDWIQIDFGSLDSGGRKFHNPDVMERSLIPIKLSENDRDNGAYDSLANAYKVEYSLHWNDVNDMPNEQLIAIRDLYSNPLNYVQVSIDGGSWFYAYLIKGGGFKWAEAAAGGYISGIPVALQQLVFREA